MNVALVAGDARHRTTVTRQISHLAQRSVTRVLRQPFLLVPSLLFPLFLLAMNSSGLSAATDIRGFPTDSYLTFALAVCFMQGALFATMASGTNLAEDIQTGFFSRLSLTPLRGSALLAGQLAGVVVLGLVQAATYLAVGLIAGAEIEAGLPGVLVIVSLSILTAIGFGSLGLFAALRTGSGEAVQGLFPLFFITLFLSSMALPRDLIEQDWFETVATINPVSYILEAIRSLLITGWDGEALALGFGVSATILILGITASALALKTRMVRT